MNSFIERVVDELKELDIKIEALRKYLKADYPQDVTEKQIVLLERQLFAMEMYGSVLEQRIIDLTKEN